MDGFAPRKHFGRRGGKGRSQARAFFEGSRAYKIREN